MEKTPRILICDDEPLITASIKELLEIGNSYEVQTTNNPKQALQLINEHSPDLVILDMMMPGMTGFDVLDSATTTSTDAAFIFVTGESSIDTAIQAIHKGASDYLKKPFDPEELRIRVANVLKQRQVRIDKNSIEAEKHLLESQLRQSHKMEAIGTLAGGIAHDFNNVLSIILGNTELALHYLPKNHGAHPHLEQIHSASLRARGMIRQLLNFSRKDETELKPVSLNRLVTESLTLMRASLPTNISIEKEVSNAECTTLADATQIHQIIYNLCINASHAMEIYGGTLGVKLRPLLLNTAAAAELHLPPGKYNHLVVSDTGRGIKSEIIERIFDPYFTTKETGKGTGMGLSVVHGIVKRCGGAIRAISIPERQTEFHLYFPRISAVAITEQAVVDRRKLPRGHEHIIVVDDEKMLADMMQRVLEQLGYKVSVFTNSAKALEAFSANPDNFDLLISDMTMPGMNGVDLIQAVKETRYNFPAILCTGYNKQVSEDNANSLGIKHLINKPVSIEQLAKAIRKVLSPEASDRRMHPRYGAPSGAYVICDGEAAKPFCLLDIGTAGLSFSHETGSAPDTSNTQLSIITADGDYIISDLPCRKVNEIPVEDPDSTRVRRGVCFENLSMMQQDQIAFFIQNHATQILH